MTVEKLKRFVDSLCYVLGAAGAGTIAAGAWNENQNLYDKGLMMVTAALGYVLGRSLHEQETPSESTTTLETLERIIRKKKSTHFNRDQVYVYKSSAERAQFEK